MVSISVVMPSFNHGKYLEATIRSVLSQTYTDFELIIVDDGSKDNSRGIIESYQTKDDRVKPFFHEKNMGISNTYNDGIRRSRGEFIAFIDSDDLWLDDKLEKQISILNANKELVVWSEGEIIDQDGKPTGEKFTQIENGSHRKKSGNIFQELLCADNFIFDSSLLLKKTSLPPNGFDKGLKYLNDYRFAVDLAKHHDYYFIDEPLAKYRVHGKNTIFNKSLDWHRDRVAIYQQFIRDYGDEIPKKTKSYMFFMMGRAYERLGQKKEARECWLSSVRTNPYGKKAILYLASALTGSSVIA